MPELGLAVTVSRTLLGLADLNINDHTNYYIADTFLGGQVQWQRNQVASPWLDGQVTVNRYRNTVQEQIVIEVMGSSQGALQTNLINLINAFNQDVYVLDITIDSTTNWQYECESADYQIAWNGPRFIARQIQVTLSVPRQPVPLGGV